jgi:hypothetical protein
MAMEIAVSLIFAVQGDFRALPSGKWVALSFPCCSYATSSATRHILPQRDAGRTGQVKVRSGVSRNRSIASSSRICVCSRVSANGYAESCYIKKLRTIFSV